MSFQLEMDLLPLKSLETVHSIRMNFGVSTMGASMYARHTERNSCMVFRGVASNEAEEAVASSLFCARTRARIGDII